MNILLISYFFDPCPAIGAKRWSGFFNASQEDESNNVTVITANWEGEKHLNPNVIYLGDPITYTPPKSINKEFTLLDIIKHPTLALRSIDATVFDKWIEHAKSWINQNNSNNYDMIIASYAPVSSILIGNYAKSVFQASLVIDLRDLISIQGQKITLPIITVIDNFLDKFITKDIDLFLTVSPTCNKKATLFYKKPTHTIYNGFASPIAEKMLHLSLKNKSRIVILYTGTLGKTRNPKKILSILDLFASKNNSKSIIVKFASQDSPYDFIEQYNFQNITIDWLGYLNKNQINQEKNNADILLLLEDQTEKGNENLTGKIYEYMEAKKPIMASCHANSDIVKLLHMTSMGNLIENIDDCENFFSLEKEISTDSINFYTYLVQYKELLKVLERV